MEKSSITSVSGLSLENVDGGTYSSVVIILLMLCLFDLILYVPSIIFQL